MSHQLIAGDRTITYPSIQAVYLDVINQLQDGEEFSVVDATGKVILTGVWHPLTPSRYS